MLVASSNILQLSVQRGTASHEVRADGELDVASTRELEAAVHEALGSARRVEIDLAGVFFCDVHGARGLVASAADATAAGVELTVRGIRGDVARVLGLLRVSLP